MDYDNIIFLVVFLIGIILILISKFLLNKILLYFKISDEIDEIPQFVTLCGISCIFSTIFIYIIYYILGVSNFIHYNTSSQLSINEKLAIWTPIFLLLSGFIMVMVERISACPNDDTIASGYMFIILGIISGIAWNFLG